MEEDFYRGRLSERFGLDVLVPEADDRRDVHAIIYQELIAGVVNERSRRVYVEVIERLVGSVFLAFAVALLRFRPR